MWVVELLNVVEHVGVDLVPGAIHLAGGPFGFQRREEAFHRRVVSHVARLAHATGDAMIRQQLLKLLTAI